MTFASLLPAWLDAFFIGPFRWLPDPTLSLWLGTAFLCAYAVLGGEITSTLLFWSHRGYYERLQDEVVKAHNLSVEALRAGNKEAYTAINKQAHERFGKAFFAQAAVGMASLWPVPFALDWLSLRFEGIPVHRIPFTDQSVGYVFVFLALYIPLRILFSRIKKRLPGFRRVEEARRRAREARGAMRSFFS